MYFMDGTVHSLVRCKCYERAEHLKRTRQASGCGTSGDWEVQGGASAEQMGVAESEMAAEFVEISNHNDWKNI